MYQYPLNFLFKITTVSNDFTATDAAGKTIFFVREKLFKLRTISMFIEMNQKRKFYMIWFPIK